MNRRCNVVRTSGMQWNAKCTREPSRIRVGMGMEWNERVEREEWSACNFRRRQEERRGEGREGSKRKTPGAEREPSALTLQRVECRALHVEQSTAS